MEMWMNTICFPDGASEKERKMAWKCLGVLRESDLPLATSGEAKQAPLQFGVRVILRNAEGKICLIISGKNHYAALVGGGIETGETIEQALCREAQEEAGCIIKNVQALGYFVEMRHSAIKNTFVFVADIDKNVGTNYTEEELAEGFYPDYVAIGEAIEKLQADDDKLAAMSEKSYNGTFANRRDLMLLREYAKL